MNERATWRGLVDAKIASSVELLGETLDFGREVDERKGESREKASGVQGHAFSQIINFSSKEDPKRMRLAKANQPRSVTNDKFKGRGSQLSRC